MLIDGSKKEKIKSKIIIIFIVGFVLGVAFTMKVFAIRNVNVPALPYQNAPIVLQEPLQLNQKRIYLELPKGTELILHYGNYKTGFKAFLPLTFSSDLISGSAETISYERLSSIEATPFIIMSNKSEKSIVNKEDAPGKISRPVISRPIE